MDPRPPDFNAGTGLPTDDADVQGESQAVCDEYTPKPNRPFWRLDALRSLSEAAARGGSPLDAARARAVADADRGLFNLFASGT